MSEIKKILTISRFTVKEVVQSKILFNVIFLGIFLILITSVAFKFTYGSPSRVALDFGLGTLSLSAIGIALFMGISLISNELESRTIYMILSRPVKRSSFIIGKYLGLSLVVALNILILSILTLSVFVYTGGVLDSLIITAVVYILMEALMMLSMVGVLSLITNKVLTVILSTTVYIIGHAIAAAKTTSLVKLTPALGKLLDFYHFVLPGFYKLNLKDLVLYDQKVSDLYIYGNIAYAVIYILFLTLLSIFIFNRKNLD